MRVLLAALVLFAVGCAPAAVFRPPGSALTASFEAGAGAVAILPRPFVDEPTHYVGQLWATRAMAHSLALSGIVALDTNALAGGAALSWVPVRGRWFRGGAEIEAGYAWAAVGLPVAAELGPVSLYASPRLGTWGDALTPAAVAGIGVGVGGGLDVRAESQLSWADFDPYNRRLHLGLAIAYRYGRGSRRAEPDSTLEKDRTP